MSRGMLAVLALAVVVVAVSGCGGSHTGGSSTEAKRTLTDLHDISGLRDAFNQASGEPRLIVLVSPT